MSKYVVDIHGDIEGDYDIIKKYEEPKTDVLDKIRAEINDFCSIWVQYKITGHTDRDIENIVKNVLEQAKEQMLDIIDEYKAESEEK